MSTQCPCGKPTTNAYLCRGCTRRLDRDLATIRDLWPESLTTMTRQNVGGGGGGKRSAQALPVNLAASEVREDVQGVVTTWLRHCAGDRTPEDVRGVRDACTWMSTYLSGLILLPEITQLADEIGDCARRLARLVDSPASSVIVGRCDVCEVDLLATRLVESVLCKGCERVIDVGAARRERIEAAWETHALPGEAATYLTSVTGKRFTEQTVKRWMRNRSVTANAAGMVPLGKCLEVAATRGTR